MLYEKWSIMELYKKVLQNLLSLNNRHHQYQALLQAMPKKNYFTILIYYGVVT